MIWIGIGVVTFFGIILGLTEGDIIAPSTSLREYTDLEEKLAMDYEVWRSAEMLIDQGGHEKVDGKRELGIGEWVQPERRDPVSWWAGNLGFEWKNESIRNALSPPVMRLMEEVEYFILNDPDWTSICVATSDTN